MNSVMAEFIKRYYEVISQSGAGILRRIKNKIRKDEGGKAQFGRNGKRVEERGGRDKEER